MSRCRDGDRGQRSAGAVVVVVIVGCVTLTMANARQEQPTAAAADTAAASAVIMTRVCCQMYGFHPEEVEVRFAECDVPSPFIGTDILLHMLFDIGAAQQVYSTDTLVSVWT